MSSKVYFENYWSFEVFHGGNLCGQDNMGSVHRVHPADALKGLSRTERNKETGTHNTSKYVPRCVTSLPLSLSIQVILQRRHSHWLGSEGTQIILSDRMGKLEGSLQVQLCPAASYRHVDVASFTLGFLGAETGRDAQAIGETLPTALLSGLPLFPTAQLLEDMSGGDNGFIFLWWGELSLSLFFKKRLAFNALNFLFYWKGTAIALEC